MAAPEVPETEHPAQAVAEQHPIVRTPKQLLLLVFFAFAVPVTVLVMLATLAAGLNRFDADHPAMTDEAIAQRIKPVGEVILAEGGAAEAAPAAAPAGAPAAGAAPSPPAPAQAAAPAAAPATAPSEPSKGAATAAADGKAVYDKVCMACHATGLAGAPKAGDKAAWAPRLQEGMETVYQIALKGKGAMPPKGGAVQMSDAEIKAAVDYMVSLVK